MKKDIRDYAHFYIGCKVIGNYGDEQRKGYLTGIHGEHEAEIQFFEEDGINVFEEPEYNRFSEIKLCLRNLSSMTEEEKISLAIIFGWDFGDNTTKANHVDTLFEKNGFYNKQTNLTGRQWNDAINHLRTQGIDCDGLIDAGLALDITKQPAQ